MSARLTAVPERSTLRKFGIALLVLGVIAGAGCAGITDGGGNDTDVDEPGVNGTDANATDPGANATGSDTNDTDSETDGTDSTTDETDSSLEGVSLIDHVPAEQDLVIHVDASITEDATTQEFLEAGNEEAEAGSEETPEGVDEGEFQQSADEFEESTGLDPLEFEEAIYFGQNEEVPDSAEAADPEDQFGLVANTGWTTAELTDAIESNESIEMAELDYEESGVYYELTNVENPEEDPLYLGMLGDGAYVIGVESTVEGSLDVAYADGDALSGTLRDAYDDASDGYVKVAMTAPEDFGVGDTGMGTGAQLAQDLEVVAGTYYTEGDQLGVEAQLTMSNENTATQLSSSATTISTLAEAGNDEVPEALQHLEVEQDGTTVIFDYASDVETLIDAADSQ